MLLPISLKPLHHSILTVGIIHSPIPRYHSFLNAPAINSPIHHGIHGIVESSMLLSPIVLYTMASVNPPCHCHAFLMYHDTAAVLYSPAQYCISSPCTCHSSLRTRVDPFPLHHRVSPFSAHLPFVPLNIIMSLCSPHTCHSF